MEDRAPAPRWRHAPPPAVRVPLQRQRLLSAAASVFVVTELASRQVRLGEPADVLDLAPVIDRLILGVFAPAAAGRG